MGAAAESEAAAGGDSNPPGRALGGASSADVASAAARRGRRILATATVNVFLGKRGGWGVEGGRVGGFGRWLNNGLEGNSKIDVRVFSFFRPEAKENRNRIRASLPALAHVRHKFLFYESYSYSSRVASSDIRARTIIMCILVLYMLYSSTS